MASRCQYDWKIAQFVFTGGLPYNESALPLNTAYTISQPDELFTEIALNGKAVECEILLCDLAAIIKYYIHLEGPSVIEKKHRTYSSIPC